MIVFIIVVSLLYLFMGTLSYFGMQSLGLDGSYDNMPEFFASIVWPITWIIIIFSFSAKYIIKEIEKKIKEEIKGRE